MEEKLKKLNLGCGIYRKEGYVNLDWDEKVKPDVVHDFNEFPYPFSDNTFDLVEAIHVIEHLDRPFSVMAELHRILKPGGLLIIKVPHFSRGFTHAEHAHGFDVTFPLYFDKKFASKFSGYTGTDFRVEKISMKWSAFHHLLADVGYGKVIIGIFKILNFVFSFFANLSPNFCSRIWCFWVGGFEEIEFQFYK
jgi:SAM-dependent methyltransferase